MESKPMWPSTLGCSATSVFLLRFPKIKIVADLRAAR